MYLLSLVATVKDIMDNVFNRMMQVGSPLESFAQVVAGLGCIIYIASLILPAIERSERIDIYPLLKPILVAFVIFNFSIVTGGLHDLSDAIGSSISELVQADDTSGRELFGKKYEEATSEELNAKEKVIEMREQGTSAIKDAFDPSNVERAKREGREVIVIDNGGIGHGREVVKDDWERGKSLFEGANNAENEAKGFWEKAGVYMAYKVFLPGLSWLAQMIGQIAYVIMILIAKFNMIILAIVGPLSFALSQFKLLSGSFNQWLARYISVGLWPGLCGIVQGMVNMVINALAGVSSTTVMENVISALIIIMVSCLYFYIPTISEFIVQSGGMGGMGSSAKRAAGTAGRAVKKAITKV